MSTIWVGRDEAGNINKTSSAPGSTGCDEEMDSNDPEVVEYLQPIQKRLLNDILNDVQALTEQQQDNCIGDLFGEPANAPKIMQARGHTAPSLLVVDLLMKTALGGMALARGKPQERRLATLYCVALWTHDNPYYLVNPPFDPTINIPGVEPVSPPSTESGDGRRMPL